MEWFVLPVYSAFALAFPAGLLYLGVRFVRAFERRSGSRGEIAELRLRVAQLEDEVASATREVARVAEAQRFDHALLGGRGAAPPDAGAPAPPPPAPPAAPPATPPAEPPAA